MSYLNDLQYQVVSNHLYKSLHVEASVQATRLLMGLRRYELKNAALPPTLNKLVPTLLDRVPRDPFSGNPFRYDPARGIVYSVGPDRVDQGGSIRQSVTRPRRRPEPHRGEDQVYSLRESFEEMIANKGAEEE